MRRKAGTASLGVIDQPNLNIFGSAIPNHYYEVLSERMLTNGFFARMVILESGPRCKGQEPRIADLPPRVLETARRWVDYRPGWGNLQDWHPVPAVVEPTDEALAMLIETREEAEAEYGKADAGSDPVDTTVWGRVSEQVRKLALLHAIGEDHRMPRIGPDAARWALRFVMHQTRRMLFMASSHVGANEFDSECKQVTRALCAWSERHGDDPMPVWRLKRALKMHPTMFRDAIFELEQRQEIRHVRIGTQERPKEGYVAE